MIPRSERKRSLNFIAHGVPPRAPRHAPAAPAQTLARPEADVLSCLDGPGGPGGPGGFGGSGGCGSAVCRPPVRTRIPVPLPDMSREDSYGFPLPGSRRLPLPVENQAPARPSTRSTENPR
ncbi:hypothetical protein GCM10018782_04530 [Streptomyces griseoaurantiacus]|nr:hypothetical protein GCM10018782_04530 [Streptomyces griseoaurantiacus]